MNATARSAALGAATALALATAPPAASADGYQFIVSGYPATNASHSGISGGASLAVGVLGDNGAAGPLEARRRTSDESPGASLPVGTYGWRRAEIRLGGLTAIIPEGGRATLVLGLEGCSGHADGTGALLDGLRRNEFPPTGHN